MRQTVSIERMGYGSEAVGRLADGKAVFVEGAAPGDVAVVEVTEEKPSFARARLVSVEEPSPDRALPACSQASRCGGCPWAHLSYEAQLSAKRDNVVAALARTAGMDAARAEELVAPCAPSKRQWGYRNKLELGVGRGPDGSLELGMRREGTDELVRLDVCPLANRLIERAPKALRGALRYAEGAQDLGIFRVGVRGSLRTRDVEVALWAKPGPFPRAHVAKLASSAMRKAGVVRVLSEPGRARKVKGVEALEGRGWWSEELAGARFSASAPSFFQVNTAQAEKLVAEVVEALGGERGLSGAFVADLYAGAGTFSVPLAAAGAEVAAVESAGTAVRDLRRKRRGQRRGRGGGGWRRRARAAFVRRAGRARGGSSASRLGRRGGRRHSRGAPCPRGVRQLQPRHLGPRRRPLRGARLPPCARTAGGPVPPNPPCGACRLLRARLTAPFARAAASRLPQRRHPCRSAGAPASALSRAQRGCSKIFPSSRVRPARLLLRYATIPPAARGLETASETRQKEPTWRSTLPNTSPPATRWR